ncbi:hypothetical protein Tco_1393830 [Tanacetum coccineum]
MPAPVITISFDVSEESARSVVSRVILFGTIPTEVPIVPDIPTDLPTTPELPAVSPFLCSDDSESEPPDELPERHVSLGHFSAMVSRDTSCPIPPGLSTEIATAPPACYTLTPVITASPSVRSRIRTTIRKSTLGLRPMMMSSRSAALRRAGRVALSPEASSSSNTLSSSSSDSALHASESSFTASLQDYATPISSSSAGPSRKRSRSLATSIPSTVYTIGALSPARADLLPPRKRYRGTSIAHSYESRNESSLETHTELDMDSNIRADIKVETAAAVTIDGLGIEPVMAGVDMGFKLGFSVVESESESEEAEADDEADVETRPQGTIEIEVDVTTRIDIPHDLPMPDTIERLEQLEDSVQERVAALEDSNTRLRDALVIERVRADTRIMTITRSGMTPEAIEELITRRVEEALAAQEANRNAGLIGENQSQNGDGDDNGSRVGPVAYTLELPEELKGIHSTFHVSNLKKCLSEGDIVVPMKEIHLDDKFHMIEEPIEIVDKEVKRLKQSRIPIVKVRWNSQRGYRVYLGKREGSIKRKSPDIFTSKSKQGGVDEIAEWSGWSLPKCGEK